jgi:hypothetical protein
MATMGLNWKCRNRSCFGRTAKAVLAALLILQVLVLLALAASPALHHAFHPDSNAPDHDCPVTLFAKGQLSEAITPVVALMAVFVICAVLPPSVRQPFLFDYRFAPSRAPPRF